MIDKRDESIYELMPVLPIGYVGYITNRLVIPISLSIVYTVLSYIILDIFQLPFKQVIMIALLSGIQSVVVSQLIIHPSFIIMGQALLVHSAWLYWWIRLLRSRR